MPLPAVRSSRSVLLLLASLLTFAAMPALADEADDDAAFDAPAWMTLYAHGNIAVDPGFKHDAQLQVKLDRAVQGMGLMDLARAGKCGIAVVDLADPMAPRVADVAGSHMVYAASIPKIGVLYAAFQKRKDGRLVIDEPFRETLTQMCRVSSNQAASAAIQKVGFPYIASVLWQSGLYNPERGGGLWVGKAYGGENDYWHRDPVANLSHGANALSLAQLLTLLAQDRLVDAESSREMREILGNPGLHHKFVRGLDSRPSTICRKSGSWSHWHGDAAFIERADKRYVAVALFESDDGERLLEDLILRLDDCVGECSPAPKAASAQPVSEPARMVSVKTTGS